MSNDGVVYRYPEGERCKGEECGKLLSQSNPYTLCGVCQTKVTARPGAGKPKAELNGFLRAESPEFARAYCRVGGLGRRAVVPPSRVPSSGHRHGGHA